MARAASASPLEQLFVAMSGSHQIWLYDLKAKKFGPFAGDSDENLLDGPHAKAKFAQPSGFASDGKTLYVADSEVSAVRTVPLNGTGEVGTLVGRGLFGFGDRWQWSGRLRDVRPFGT